MKVVTIVGARPQFIKAAVVSKELRRKHREILLHTGQHFDYNMSQQFFEELSLPEADYNLGIFGGTHAQMTGKMLEGIEKVLLQEKPDCVLVYGDTNSTLAGALAAAKLHIPVCHVEAGLRVNNRNNPEEINRICTDHLASLLLACTESGYAQMAGEGLQARGVLVGDPMYDAFLQYKEAKKLEEITLELLEGSEAKVSANYYYLTCHREENTKEDAPLLEIFKAMESLAYPTIYPVHPRNKARALRLKKEYGFENILACEPVGYLESIALLSHAKAVVTDSGGVQREAFFAGKKCVSVLDFVCWPETMVDGRNVLSRPKAQEILAKLAEPQYIDSNYLPFGDGHSAKKIVLAMERLWTEKTQA